MYELRGEVDNLRLGLRTRHRIVDVNRTAAASMAPHMSARRAAEIAAALAPSDLPGFLDNGRHAWNAVTDSLARLGEAIENDDLRAPDGERVSFDRTEVALRALIPGVTTRTGAWLCRPLPMPGSDVPVFLHDDGGRHLPEYLAVIGRAGVDVPQTKAWDHVALFAVVRPSDADSAALLATVDELHPADDELVRRVAVAVATASRARPLLVGDVVRTGLPVDIPAFVDLTAAEDRVPA